MGGSTLTMVPAAAPAGSFHRSHSTTELYSLADSKAKHLPALPFEVPSFESGFNLETTLSFTTEELELPFLKDKTKPATIAAAPKQTESDTVERPKIGRSNTFSERTRSWLPSSKSASNVRGLLASFSTASGRDSVSQEGGRTSETHETQPARPGSVSTLASPPWSRDSTSYPGLSQESSDVPTLPRDKGSRKGLLRFPKPSGKDDGSRSADSARPSPKPLSRASTYISMMNQRPSTVFGKLGIGSDSDSSLASSSTSLALPTATTDTSVSNPTSVSDLSSSTDASSLDTHSRSGEPDPLLSVFMNLDVEIGLLESKPTPPSLRMHAVKTILLPFLHQHADPEATRFLQPEDIERRATILNKWWAMLLRQLGDLGVQPTPGVDRLSLLNALTLLMTRPEWRQMTSFFLPLTDRSPTERVRRRAPNPSTGFFPSFADGEEATDSAEKNVRAMFVSNLVRQMELVVEKMAQRNAPVGLVNFCGKACAYAFFFAPGVAEILVRLWGLDTLLIQRAADELRLPRRSNGESEDIVALFPPCLGDLGWSSIPSMGSSLRKLPKMCLELANIRWYSPWIGRWRGSDTDLFYIFCKYYHILAEEFMPPGLPLIEKARAPGFVLVQSQILSILDTTVHRQAAIQAYGAVPPLSDDIRGVDATATAMPGLPADLFKSMSQNRLVSLLKNIMSDTSTTSARARETYAETFMALVKAAVKRTSQFNYSACHTLCDFLEEVLMVYDGAEIAGDPSTHFTDWPYWFNVCRLMLESLNTVSEIRVLCFIYTIWDAAARLPDRKEALCLDWLLSEQTFYRLFNHWCPMVRSYFMRLLCWRICRDTGSANKMDTKIFLVVASRLKTVWAHYLYLERDAEYRGRYPPSTAPCYPTPGKKFMIIRTEVNTPPANYLIGFDTIGKLPAPDELAERFGADDVLRARPDGKKRWSLLGFNKVLPLKNDSKSSASDYLDRGQPAPSPPPKVRKSGKSPSPLGSGASSPASEPTSRAGSPDFDAPRYVFRFVLNWYPPAAVPPVARFLSPPRLPFAAQALVRNRSKGIGEPSPVAAGLPPITRGVSGSAQLGLIDGARNASPLGTSEPTLRRSSISSGFSRAASDLSASDNSDERSSLNLSLLDRGPTSRPDSQQSTVESLTQPVKPSGVFANNSAYSGRALAEWSIVVHECNVFVERRRDEGVLGLSEVEVPTLSLENCRRAG